MKLKHIVLTLLLTSISPFTYPNSDVSENEQKCLTLYLYLKVGHGGRALQTAEGTRIVNFIYGRVRQPSTICSSLLYHRYDVIGGEEKLVIKSLLLGDDTALNLYKGGFDHYEWDNISDLSYSLLYGQYSLEDESSKYDRVLKIQKFILLGLP